MTKETMKLAQHRCVEMPPGARIMDYDLIRDAWMLFKEGVNSHDHEWELRYFYDITFCPWCGRKLEVMEE